jgi:hypothetical protein
VLYAAAISGIGYAWKPDKKPSLNARFGGGGPMNFLSKIVTLAVILMSLIALWISCTDDDATVISSANTSDMTVSDYFPLTGGYTVYFQVDNNVIDDTITYRFCLGAPENDGTRLVYPWSYTNVDYPNQTDTGYLYIADDALYYYDDHSLYPEKILQGPFEVGRSWLRFEDPVITGEGQDYPYTDNENAKDYGFDENNDWYSKYDDDYDGDGAAKTYPVEGSNACYITAIEGIDLNNGLSFKDCLRVTNYSNGLNNYYWYAPGRGLVKYQIGVGLSAADDGNVIGEYMQRMDE